MDKKELGMIFCLSAGGLAGFSIFAWGVSQYLDASSSNIECFENKPPFKKLKRKACFKREKSVPFQRVKEKE